MADDDDAISPYTYMFYYGYLLHFILWHRIAQLCLLKPCGVHALVRMCLALVGHCWVGGVEASLYEGFTPLTRDHGLQLTSGECVHVSSLAGH